MTQVYAFEPPERFVAGTVGPPGGRTFFLQARGGGRLVSVSLEKVQVSVLADRVNDRLDALALAWDPTRGVVVIECHDQDPEEADEATLQTLRVVLSPQAARAFARRCGAVVSAG